MKTNNLEILAPCGNLENFNTAIYQGANAVYLGLSDFNARMKADNFNKDNIKDIVSQAHLFGVKVYLTLNTLIKTKEFPQLIEVIKTAVEAKVDAFIVQDLGVAKLIREGFPNAILHASTQLGVHNLYGAKMLEQLGFTRVVLSRETKLEDIKQIAKNTSLEIEYFVHGALCVAFSGNCYFSSFKFGESGNRGRCLQLCRLPYLLKNDNIKVTGYALSPSDLCLINNLKTLIDAGVTSFKIEGRLKRAGYVAETIHAYKKALESLNKNWDIQAEIIKLKTAFSRGDFNENAYLKNNTPDKIINTNFNNHTGVLIGKVLNCKKFKDLFELTLKCNHKLSAGDGLKFFDNNKEIGSMGVGNVIELGKDVYKVFTKREIKQNANVYLTLDAVSDNILLSKVNKIKINAKLIAKENKPLSLTLKKDDITLTVTSNYICPIAKNKATLKEEIQAQISKTGDSEFLIQELIIDAENIFIPKSVLNEIRRDALAKLKETIIIKANNRITTTFDNNKIKHFLHTTNILPTLKFKNIIQFNDINSLKYLNISNETLFAFAPDNFNTAKTQIAQIQDMYKDINIALTLPIIANHNDLKIIDNILTFHKDLILIANNLYGLYYISKGYKVIAGTGLNTLNNFSASKLFDMGVNNIILSTELNKENLIENENLFIYTFGFFPLMTFAHCPHKTLNNNTCTNCSYQKDIYIEDNQNSYKIRRYKISNCYFELLNSNLINITSKHNYSKFIDIRELSNSELIKIKDSLNQNINFKIKTNENYGMFLKEIK